MYLKTALNLAIPLAIEDRIEMAAAYGGEGPEAEEAIAMCKSLSSLKGVRVASFTTEQRELARLALCYAEQYLDGYIDATKGAYPKETQQARRKRMRIREVRFHHFGPTYIESMSKDGVLVDSLDYVRDLFKKDSS